MALGYDGKLFILAFDHRGSFQKKMFGIEGDPTPEQTETISDAKHLIWEGMVGASEQGRSTSTPPASLVDEQFGGPKNIPSRGEGARLQARDAGREVAARTSSTSSTATTSARTSSSSTRDFSKVLVRYNPDDPDTEMNQRQLERLKRLADWLHENDRHVPLRAAGARRPTSSSRRWAATPTATTPSCARS